MFGLFKVPGIWTDIRYLLELLWGNMRSTAIIALIVSSFSLILTKNSDLTEFSEIMALLKKIIL
jgi:hypothetical protein